MKILPSGGITAPVGFLASGIHSGIKRTGKDIALIYSEIPCIASGLFTTNKASAAPVKLTKERIKKGIAQAIIVNSGNANCMTGKRGMKDAKLIGKIVSSNLKMNESSVLIASTGVIGRPLPVKKIERNIPILIKRLSRDGGNDAALAIMTTDTKPKEIAVKINTGKDGFTISGIAKGAGMIYPHLATMLAFITTDALIEQTALTYALKTAVNISFNSITVDGCMSTNDMVLVLANGLAKNHLISIENRAFKMFCEGMNYVCLQLAKRIIQDAEGSTKFVTIRVEGANSYSQAKRVAMAIANSNLVKASIFGEDHNRGRIMAAVGSCGMNLDIENVSVRLNSFKKDDINIIVDLNRGECKATVYTSDLSPEYVRLNARYN